MSSKSKSNNILNAIKWTLALSAFLIAVVGNSYFSATPFLYRVLGVLGLFIIGLAILATTEFGRNSLRLMFESRTELRRVVWPTRTETTQTTLIVTAAVLVASLILWGLDSLF